MHDRIKRIVSTILSAIKIEEKAALHENVYF